MQTIVKKHNNLNINLIKTNKFKFVNMQISFTFDIDYQDIAALNILHNVLTTRNEEHQNFKEFSSYLEENYGMIMRGNFFNRGNVGVFSIYSTAMNSKYTMGENLLLKQVNTLKTCLFKPVLTQESLDEIKGIYIEKLKERLNKKTYILKKKINENLGKDTPYGINIEGDIDSINLVTLDKLKEVYNKLLQTNCSVYVCGDVNEEEINLFDDFSLKSNDDNLLDLSYLKDLEKKDVCEYESSFLQSAISIIYQCNINYNDELYYAFKLFIEMLNYDLFKIVREQHNYCYYIYAISNNYLNTFEIVSEIESVNLDSVIKLVEEIIHSYSDNFNTEQFLLCKNKILTYIKTSLDSPRDMIDIQFGFDFNKLINNISELEERYVNVTEEQIKQVSKMVSLKVVSILKEVANNG